MSEITPITREEKLWNGEDLEPLTREEMYIKRIFDKTQAIPNKPLTRKEMLMEKAGEGGGDVSIKQLSVTANGTYSEEGTAYSPVNVAVPLAEKSVTENGVYNASADSVAGYSKVNVNVPLPENAYLLKESSGSLVSFSDGADLPMPSFICNIDAVQDLHGYDTPWVGGAGKNKFPILIGDDVWVGNQGATYTSSNGVLIIESLAPTNTSSGVYSSSNSKMRELLATLDGEYVYSFEIKCNKEARITCGITNHGNIARPVSTNWIRYEIPTTFSIGENVGCVFYNYSKTENLEIQVRNFMIQQGTTATPYETYSNICPISGHTGVDAWVRGKNLLSVNSLSLNRDTQRAISSNIQPIPKGTYTISCDYSGTSRNTSFILRKSQNDQTDQKQFAVTDIAVTTFTIDETYSAIYAFIGTDQASGTTAEISNLMIRPFTETDAITTYEPYNPNSQTIQVSWQTEAGEVFDGYVDLVSGELTVTHKEITYDGVTSGKMFSSRITGSNNAYYNSLPDGFDFNTTGRVSSTDMKKYGMINSHYDYTDDSSVGFYAGIGTTTGYLQPRILFGADSDITTVELANQWLAAQYANGTPWQVKYPLKTPITYQLTPTQIKSLVGYNNAWCSTGDVDIDYFAKEVTG